MFKRAAVRLAILDTSTIDVYCIAMKSESTAQIERELRQNRPFQSVRAAAAISILRTADVVRRRAVAVIEPFGISLQQYNVLRILRGSSPDPLPTLEIGERLIERTPGVTRLLDRLEEKGLVRRERCADDRRMVHCWITETGLELLDIMDAPVDEMDDDILREIPDEDVVTLIRLMDQVRSTNE
jgi:DNA-binding MarR family transcriptional regulator